MTSKFQNSIFILLFAIFLVGCGNSAPIFGESSNLPDSEVEEIIAEARVEVTEDGSVTSLLGELNLDYPLLILADTNDTVVITINKLDVELEPSPDFVSVTTEIVPATALGERDTYTANIYIAEQVRIELSSQSFTFDTAFGSTTRQIDVVDSSNTTTWAWDMKAPNSIGVHKFTVKVFLEDELIESWGRTIPVTVVNDLPAVPTPVITPSPPANSSRGFAPTLIGILVVLILLGVGGTVYLRSKGSGPNGPGPTVHKRTLADKLNAVYKVELTNALEEAFNTTELKDLCFNLDIVYDNFEGGFIERLQGIVSHFLRHSRLKELLAYLAENRPDIEVPKHQLAAVLENQFSRTELKGFYSHLDIEDDDEIDDPSQLSQTIMTALTNDDKLQDFIDYLTQNHPETDLPQGD